MANRYESSPVSPSDPGYPSPPSFHSHDESHYPPIHSSASLPRYNSAGSVGSYNTMANSNSLSPLNPSAKPAQKYSSYGYANGGPNSGGGAHPLSHALYASDSPSTPTLAGDDHMDEKKGLAAFPPSSPAYDSGNRRNPKNVYQRWSGAFIADSGKDEKHTKVPRLGWIDGLRFLAAWIILNGTVLDHTITSNDYTAIQRNSPLYLFRSSSFGLALLLMISGRALMVPMWDTSKTATNSSNLGKYGGSAEPTISWARLTRGLLLRPFRFILPVIVIVALQWGLASSTKNAVTVGMINPPHWDQIRSFGGYTTVVFDSFSTFFTNIPAAQYFAGNLWFNAWLFQSGYAVYIIHLMVGNMPSNRYWVYIILAFFSWTTHAFFYMAILGLIIADMSVHGRFQSVRSWPLIRRLLVQCTLLALGLLTQWINPVRDGLNKGLANINVSFINPQLQFADSILAACIIIIVECSDILQFILGNVVMRMLGKLSAGMVLLSPIVLFTMAADVANSMNKSKSAGTTILATTWVVTFLVSVGLAIPFHLLVELPSKLAGEFFGDFVEHWGRLTPEEEQKKYGAKK